MNASPLLLSFLLVTSPLLANDIHTPNDTDNRSAGKSTRPVAADAWVAAPNASFDVRTAHTPDGRLMVSVLKKADRHTVLSFRSAGGETLEWIELPAKPGMYRIPLNVSALADGDYRIEVANSRGDKVIKNIQFATPTAPRTVALSLPPATR